MFLLLSSLAGTLLAAADVTTDALVEEPEASGQEVSDVGEVEKRQRNSDQSVDDRQNTTEICFRRNVAIAYA